jgi:hypothetical protein
MIIVQKKAAEQLNEQRRAEYSNFLKERSNDILHLNNEIARLQKDLDRSRKNQDEMETEVHARIKRNQEKTVRFATFFYVHSSHMTEYFTNLMMLFNDDCI